MAKKSEPDWGLAVLGTSAFFLFLRLRKEAEKAAPKTSLGFDEAQQWAYDKAHGGTRWGPRSMGGGYDTFGASRPSRYVPSERNALWWGRRGMNPPWEAQ